MGTPTSLRNAHTLFLLDRFFGPDRQADDQLTRIENAANEYANALEHLWVTMREAANLLAGEPEADDIAEAVEKLTTEATWAETHAPDFERETDDALAALRELGAER